MKNLHQCLRVTLCLLAAVPAQGAEIKGVVRDAAGGTASIITSSELFPNVGDKLEIFFRIPGGDDEVLVGTGQVSAIEGDAIQVKIATATGTVAKNQLARIISEKPVKRPAIQPPTTPVVITPPEVPNPPSVTTPMPPPTVTPPTAPTAPGVHVNIVPPGLITTPRPPQSTNDIITAEVNLGLSKFNTGDFDGAIIHFSEAVRIAPENGILYFNRASSHLRKGNIDAVITDCDKALTLGTRNPADVFVLRGTARASKGDFDAAIFDCNRAIKINPNHALAYNNRANNRIRKSDWKGALEDSNRAVSLDPNLALAYYNRGYARANSGDDAGAITDWTKAIQMQPGFQLELGRQIEISRAKRGRR